MMMMMLSVSITRFYATLPTGSPSCGGDVAIYVGIYQPSLPTSFYSVLVSVSVFVTLSNVFHSINSPDNCPFSRSFLFGLISALFKLLVLSTVSLYDSFPQP